MWNEIDRFIVNQGMHLYYAGRWEYARGNSLTLLNLNKKPGTDELVE